MSNTMTRIHQSHFLVCELEQKATGWQGKAKEFPTLANSALPRAHVLGNLTALLPNHIQYPPWLGLCSPEPADLGKIKQLSSGVYGTLSRFFFSDSDITIHRG